MTDHLRVCGADTRAICSPVFIVGSPPRVRSRRPRPAPCGHRRGITSACAEQTYPVPARREACGDHLRVCGADQKGAAMTTTNPGSPPRVRSRREHVPVGRQSVGITSACAEQTTWARCWIACVRDHLRVCGADVQHHLTLMEHLGSPPRVRSRPCEFVCYDFEEGITSACAEQTSRHPERPGRRRDHLRVCGADKPRRLFSTWCRGSPPRVRSRLSAVQGAWNGVGITSACAEQTWPAK